jgi:hypothetical protein
MNARHVSFLALLLFVTGSSAELPKVDKVAYQPFVAATSRVIEALDYVGAPLSESDTKAIRTAMMPDDRKSGVTAIEAILDRYCVTGGHINPESRVKVSCFPANPNCERHPSKCFTMRSVGFAAAETSHGN